VSPDLPGPRRGDEDEPTHRVPERIGEGWREPAEAGTGFALFHALDFTAALLIVGLALAFWRRTRDVGLMTVQRFGFDLVPLVLLFAIAVTGLALTASTLWWEGRFYWFISLVHQVTVVGWLLSLPFGKFFHIVQRPASIGVTLYQTVNQDVEHYGAQPQTGTCRRCRAALPSRQFVDDLKATLADLGQTFDLGPERGWLLSLPFGKFFHIVQRPASIGVTLYQVVNQDVEHYGTQTQTGACRRCGAPLPSQQFVDDLKATLVDLGQRFDLGPERGWLPEYCPTCKRVLRGQAYYRLFGNRFL
jgi:hypothetical protein